VTHNWVLSVYKNTEAASKESMGNEVKQGKQIENHMAIVQQ